MMITLIAAQSRNGVIGANGGIPWKHKQDMVRFQTLTMGKIVVMGRKTYESLGRKPLVGRRNVVISRTLEEAPGCKLVDEVYLRNDLWIIGGEEIYRLYLPFAQRVELTELFGVVKGDTHFPKLDPTEWYLTKSRRGLDCWFLTYERKLPTFGKIVEHFRENT